MSIDCIGIRRSCVVPFAANCTACCCSNAFIVCCNASAVHVQGATSDKDSVGRLVWAVQPGSGKDGGMWPAEVLDVACLPRGRSIPREALAALDQSERLLLQQYVEKAHPEGKSAERILLEGLKAADAGSKPTTETGGAPDAGADDGNAKKGKGSKAASGASKGTSFTACACHVPKVFVIFFGSNRWAWLPQDSLLDFAEHREYAFSRLHCSSTTRGADAVIMRKSRESLKVSLLVASHAIVTLLLSDVQGAGDQSEAAAESGQAAVRCYVPSCA